MAKGLPPRILVRMFLAQKGKTQSWLAQRMHMSDSTVSAVLAGARSVTPEFTKALAAITGVDLTPFPRTKSGRLTGRGIRRMPDHAPDAESILT